MAGKARQRNWQVVQSPAAQTGASVKRKLTCIVRMGSANGCSLSTTFTCESGVQLGAPVSPQVLAASSVHDAQTSSTTS